MGTRGRCVSFPVTSPFAKVLPYSSAMTRPNPLLDAFAALSLTERAVRPAVAVWALGVWMVPLCLLSACSGGDRAMEPGSEQVSASVGAEGSSGEMSQARLAEESPVGADDLDGPREGGSTTSSRPSTDSPFAPKTLAQLAEELDDIPSDIRFDADPELLLEGDPPEFPVAASFGGVVVEVVRERHPQSGVLLRIATVRQAEREEGARPILHGPEWLFYGTGALRSTTWWREDIRHGPIKQWRDVGTKTFEGRFEAGQRDGLRREYSEEGVLVEQRVYAGGRMHGPFREWYPGGERREEATFANGQHEGRRRLWNVDGMLLQDESYRKGVRDGRWTEFHPETGAPKTWGSFDKGKRVGIWQKGTPNGKIVETTAYEDGAMHGTSKAWSATGQLIRTVEYERGEKTGLTRAWYGDGTSQSEGHFDDGARVGRWMYWREDGSVNDTWSGLYEADRRTGPLPSGGDDR